MSRAAPVNAVVRERPILFSGPMVKAILGGTKTQTRRVVAPENSEFGSAPRRFWSHADLERAWSDGKGVDRNGAGFEYLHVPAHAAAGCLECARMGWEDTSHRLFSRVAPAMPDLDAAVMLEPPPTRLWVRETWLELDRDHYTEPAHPRDWLSDRYGPPRRNGCAYRAECDADSDRIRAEYGYRWKPSIFMPRWASRLTLEIADVRVQRLQEITAEDARAEGAPVGEMLPGSVNGEPAQVMAMDPLVAFAWLWNSINGKRAPWASNPWVWAISFRRVA
jgi:hypothetical protein